MYSRCVFHFDLFRSILSYFLILCDIDVIHVFKKLCNPDVVVDDKQFKSRQKHTAILLNQQIAVSRVNSTFPSLLSILTTPLTQLDVQRRNTKVHRHGLLDGIAKEHSQEYSMRTNGNRRRAITTYAFRPDKPSSRPMPDCLTPPKGT